MQPCGMDIRRAGAASIAVRMGQGCWTRSCINLPPLPRGHVSTVAAVTASELQNSGGERKGVISFPQPVGAAQNPAQLLWQVGGLRIWPFPNSLPFLHL